MTTNKKIFIHSGKILLHGDKIKGTIDGKKVEGKIYVCNHNTAYFCQNSKDGDYIGNKFGYDYSWIFKSNKKELTQGVIIDESCFRKKNEEIINQKEIGCKNDGIFIKNISYLIHNDKLFEYKDKNSSILFSVKQHPDCCGCTLYYNFCCSNSNNYSRYKDLTEEDYKMVEEFINDSNESSKIVHLSHKQRAAISFVEKLGFKKIHEYKNPKSDNTIYIYQRDYIEN